VHGPQQYANASAATSLGQGVGGLLQALDQMNAGRRGGAGISFQPIVGGVTGVQPLQGPKVVGGGAPPMGSGPIMTMIGQLLKAF